MTAFKPNLKLSRTWWFIASKNCC